MVWADRGAKVEGERERKIGGWTVLGRWVHGK